MATRVAILTPDNRFVLVRHVSEFGPFDICSRIVARGSDTQIPFARAAQSDAHVRHW
jgi:hypothetical protein